MHTLLQLGGDAIDLFMMVGESVVLRPDQSRTRCESALAECSASLMRVDTSGCMPAAVIIATRHLGRYGGLVDLNFSSCQIGSRLPDLGIQIAACVTGARSLRRLNVSSNRLGPTAAVALLQALDSNKHIEAVDVSSNRLCGGWDRLDASGYAAVIAAASKLRSATAACVNMAENLSLSAKCIDSNGARELAECVRLLATSNSMESLDLQDNYLVHGTPHRGISTAFRESDASGMFLLGKALEAHGGLTSLNISDCRLGSVGAGIIASVVARSESLSSLNVAGSKLTQGSVTCITDGWPVYARDMAGINRLSKAIAANSKLTTLVLSGDDANSRPVTMLSTTEEADYSGMLLQAPGALLIAAFIPRCKQLRSINLCFNLIPEQALHLVVRRLLHCRDQAEPPLVKCEPQMKTNPRAFLSKPASVVVTRASK
jgi:hypothetical protein